MDRIVGLDLGEKISFCEVKKDLVVERATVVGIAGLARLLGPNTPSAKVAFEACREAWAVHDQLLAWGHEPLMIDTTRVRQLGIGQHRRKNDRIDAETIARALAVGRVPLAHVLSPHRRQLRLQLGMRRGLVETRAQFSATIRGVLRAQGQRLPMCEPETLPRRLAEAQLDDETRLLVEPMAKVLEALTPQIKLVEAKLEQLCAGEPVVRRLSTVPGVALIVAAAFVSVIDEAKRFHGAHQVEAYLGLVPSENTSGKRRMGAITKQGNSYMRALLMQSAHCIMRLRADDPLKRWGENVEQRRGKKIALVAVARRLVGILWAIWRDGTSYQITKLGQASARGLSSHAEQLKNEAAQMRADVVPTGNRRTTAGASKGAPISREVSMT